MFGTNVDYNGDAKHFLVIIKGIISKMAVLREKLSCKLDGFGKMDSLYEFSMDNNLYNITEMDAMLVIIKEKFESFSRGEAV